MNQTEQTTVSAAWEQNTIFQELEKLEICKWRDLSLGDYKVRDVEDRGISKYGPTVVLRVEKQGVKERGFTRGRLHH